MMLTRRLCAACSRPLHGRIDRKTCSDACRQALARARAVTEAVTEAVTPAAAVTGWRDEDPTLADPEGHWHRIGGARDDD